MKIRLKQIILIGVILTLFSAIGFAESMYVTDVIKLTLRSGPSTEYKILAVVESGQKVEVLEPGEDWSLVRLPDGKEGYMLTRYLISEPTSSVLLEQLQEKHKALTEQATTLLEENTQLREENQNLKGSLEKTEKTLNTIEGDYQELKAGSAEYLTLKTQHQKVSGQLAEQTQKAQRLEAELRKVEVNQYIKWFLAGSGVLLVGFIVGFSARRQRRRPSLL
jgi:SH3 domain protein